MSKDPQQWAREIQDAIFRKMTPGQRVDCALRWTELTLELSRATIRKDHPDWTPKEVDREVGRRITGIDVRELPINKSSESTT